MATEDDQPIEEAKADRRHREQIHRGDAGGMVAQKGLPGLAQLPSASPHPDNPPEGRDLSGRLGSRSLAFLQTHT
jgi:hypothetical protein